MRITYQELAAMSAEELLAIQNTAEYDKWHYLELLLVKAPDCYMQEMKYLLANRKYDGIQWLAVWCKNSFDAAAYLEMESALEELQESRQRETARDNQSEKAISQQRTNEFIYSNRISYNYMSYLYDYSQRFRDWWKEFYQNRITHTGQVIGVYYFVPFRQIHMGVPQFDSFHALLDCGWDVRQIFLSYAAQNNSLSPALDSEAIARLVEEFPLEAMELTDIANWHHYININPFDNPSSNLNYTAQLLVKWLHLLYRFCGWTDRAPLEAGLHHKRKNVRQLCSELLAELDNPINEMERYNQGLGKVGLYGANESVPLTPKMEKQRKMCLVSAWVCQYSWQSEVFQQTFLSGTGMDAAPTLLWGIYREGVLFQPFYIVNKALMDLDENLVQLYPEDYIRLVHPIELEPEVLKSWKKRFKEKKLKQPFSQLSLPIRHFRHGDIEGKTIRRYNGLVRSQLSIITTAGKWSLEKTEGYAISWICYHLTNPVYGLGAQLNVERIWGGPEYNQEERVFGDACFYRLPGRGFSFGELVPEAYQLHPDEIPLCFASSVLSIFDMVTGWKDR